MGSRKFSWCTIVHPDYEGWPAPPLFRLAGPAIGQSGEVTCDTYYRPNRKGGHRQNHAYNCSLRRQVRSKHERLSLKRIGRLLVSQGLKL